MHFKIKVDLTEKFRKGLGRRLQVIRNLCSYIFLQFFVLAVSLPKVIGRYIFLVSIEPGVLGVAMIYDHYGGNCPVTGDDWLTHFLGPKKN